MIASASHLKTEGDLKIDRAAWIEYASDGHITVCGLLAFLLCTQDIADVSMNIFVSATIHNNFFNSHPQCDG